MLTHSHKFFLKAEHALGALGYGDTLGKNDQTRVIQFQIYPEKLLHSFTHQNNFRYLYCLAGEDLVGRGLK